MAVAIASVRRDIGTSAAGEPGPPRVVIENGDVAASAVQAQVLRDAGLEVLVCGGPLTLPDGVCPLVSRGSCSLVDAADVVVYDLDLDRPADRVVLVALQELAVGRPVVVEVSAATARRHAGTLDGCEVVLPFSPERLRDAVVAALPDGTRDG